MSLQWLVMRLAALLLAPTSTLAFYASSFLSSSGSSSCLLPLLLASNLGHLAHYFSASGSLWQVGFRFYEVQIV